MSSRGVAWESPRERFGRIVEGVREARANERELLDAQDEALNQIEKMQGRLEEAMIYAAKVPYSKHAVNVIRIMQGMEPLEK